MIQHQIGEICIEGDGLAKGYKNNDFLTEQAFVYLENGVRVYKTGDYGIINEAGKLKCLGRNDDQVKILGHRVELEDIDNNLKLCPEILDCATCFEKETEQLVTFYIAERESGHDILTGFLREKLPSHMIPEHFVRVAEFPYNSNGKLDRKELLKKYDKNSGDESAGLTNHAGDYGERVFQIVADCMEHTECGLNKETKIADLQWNSLTYVRIIVALEEEFEISFDTECLTSTYFSTIGELEEYIYTKKDKKGGNYHYGKNCRAAGK